MSEMTYSGLVELLSGEHRSAVVRGSEPKAGSHRSSSCRPEDNPDTTAIGPNGVVLQRVRLAPFCALWIEYSNVQARGMYPDVGCVDEHIEQPHIELADQKLHAALALIDTVSPQLSQVISRWCARLIVRRDASHYKNFGAYSARIRRGDIGLINVDHPEVDTARLADAIIHEAIHSVLYYTEGNTPLLLPVERITQTIAGQFGSRAKTVRVSGYPTHVRSPWTGRPLPLRSFLHSTFVWYGLATFWGTCATKSIGSPIYARAIPLRDFAARGFQQPVFRENLESSASVIAEEVRNCAEMMCAKLVTI